MIRGLSGAFHRGKSTSPRAAAGAGQRRHCPAAEPDRFLGFLAARAVCSLILAEHFADGGQGEGYYARAAAGNDKDIVIGEMRGQLLPYAIDALFVGRGAGGRPAGGWGAHRCCAFALFGKYNQSGSLQTSRKCGARGVGSIVE